MKIEYAGSLEDNKRLAQELASVDSLAGLRTRLLAQDPELTSGQLEELSLKWKAVGILHLFGRQAGKTIPVVYLWIIIYQRPADQERIA